MVTVIEEILIKTLATAVRSEFWPSQALEWLWVLKELSEYQTVYHSNNGHSLWLICAFLERFLSNSIKMDYYVI